MGYDRGTVASMLEAGDVGPLCDYFADAGIGLQAAKREMYAAIAASKLHASYTADAPFGDDDHRRAFIAEAARHGVAIDFTGTVRDIHTEEFAVSGPLASIVSWSNRDHPRSVRDFFDGTAFVQIYNRCPQIRAMCDAFDEVRAELRRRQ